MNRNLPGRVKQLSLRDFDKKYFSSFKTEKFYIAGCMRQSLHLRFLLLRKEIKHRRLSEE